jgi:hypothetical protein
VRFDKTHQNVDQLGIVDFLSQEPARAAAASPKCFYFQEDHWRSSVVQSNGSTVLYEWIGHYFFDKANGDGGAWVSGFSVGGQTYDPSQLPGFPPQYAPFFGPGTGGFITHNEVPVDSDCAARAKANPGAIYARAAGAPRCVPGVGHVTRRGVGPLMLGFTEARVRAELGPPQAVKRGFLHYCVGGGGELLIGEPGDRSGTFGWSPRARVVMLLATSRRFVWHRPRSLAHARRLLRLGRITVVQVGRKGVIVALARRRIVYLGVYSRRAIHSRGALRSYLRRVR